MKVQANDKLNSCLCTWNRTKVVVACFSILGCATPYQESGQTGGFEQRMIAEDFYAIKFQGNGFTRPERVKDFSMLRAAEIGRKLNFTHFVVAGSEDLSRTEHYTTGTTSNTTGSAYGTGNYATYSGTTTTHTNTMPVYKPGVEIGVKFFEGQPTGRYLEVYEVSEVLARLRAKYGMTASQ